MTGLRLAFGFLVAFAGVGVVVCGVDVIRGPRQPATTVVFVTAGRGPYWQMAAAGARAAARERGVDLRIEMPAGEEAAFEQMRLLDEVEATRPAGIAVCPVRPGEQFATIERLSGRSKLCTVMADVPKSGRLCHVGVSHYSAGAACAHAAVDSLPHGGKILVLFARGGEQALSARLAGFNDAMRRRAVRQSAVHTPLFEVVEYIDVDGTVGNAATELKRALARHPDVACVAAMHERGAVELADQIAAAGRLNAVRLITLDQSDKALEQVEAGRIYAAIAHDPFELGYVTVAWLAGLCRGDSMSLPMPNKGYVNVRIQTVRLDNLAAFRGHGGAARAMPPG